MKLQDIVEASFTGFPGVKFKDYDEKEVAEVIRKVMNSDKFLELTKIAPLTSTPLQIRHGMLCFKVSPTTFYDVDVHGNIRYRIPSDSPYARSKVSRGKLAVPIPDPDLYTRYMNCFDEVFKKLERSEKKSITSFEMYNKGLTSLTDFDLSEIVNSINVSGNSLSNLEGCPTVLKGSLNVSRNKVPLSLKGCPKKIGRDLNLSNCELLDLDELPLIIGNQLTLWNSKITSLEGIGKRYVRSCKHIDLQRCDYLKSNILGLLTVKKLIDIDCDRESQPLRIISRAILSGDHDIMEVREELIQAGFKEFAKL